MLLSDYPIYATKITARCTNNGTENIRRKKKQKKKKQGKEGKKIEKKKKEWGKKEEKRLTE